MRTRLLAATLVILGTMAFSTLAHAQTTSNGPYYATPSWDQKLQCDTQATCPRFIVLSNWNSEAVLDRETGLVWERSPDVSSLKTWFTARSHCLNRGSGARKGWRLPSIQELQSLLDPSIPVGSLSLPPGHPFTNVRFEPRNPDFYWSATTAA